MDGDTKSASLRPPTQNKPLFLHRYLHVQTPLAFLCVHHFHSGHVLTLGSDLHHVHVGVSHACHYSVRMFYLAAVPSLQARRNLSLVGCSPCSEKVREILKVNPKHYAIRFFFFFYIGLVRDMKDLC